MKPKLPNAVRARIHDRIAKAVTVQDMWRMFNEEVLVPHGIVAKDDDVAAFALKWFQRSFYAGASGMLDLMLHVAPDDVDLDQGAEMLQRLSDELRTYAKDEDRERH